MSDIVKYEQADGVAIITLNRPDAMNSFTSQLSFDLLAALERQPTNDSSVRALVLTGEGRCFSAGADLKGGLEGRTGLRQAAVRIPPRHDGGRVDAEARDRGSARIGCRHRPVDGAALRPADHGGQCIPAVAVHDDLAGAGRRPELAARQQLGYRRAFQLSVESERIDAERCVELGLANKAVPAEQLQAAALQWAQALVNSVRHCRWPPPRKLMRLALDQDWETSLQRGSRACRVARGVRRQCRGVLAFFEKREPEFKGQ